jgi:hypothetical protein
LAEKEKQVQNWKKQVQHIGKLNLEQRMKVDLLLFRGVTVAIKQYSIYSNHITMASSDNMDGGGPQQNPRQHWPGVTGFPSLFTGVWQLSSGDYLCDVLRINQLLITRPYS